MAEAPPPGGLIETIRNLASPEVAEHWQGLRRACEEAGPLEPKYQYLIRLSGLSIVRFQDAFKAQCRFALDAGATPDEIRQAVLLTLGSTAGMSPMLDALRWANEVIASRG